MSSYISLHSWKCPECKLDRLPEEEIVKQDNKFYLLRICRVCKYHDIEEYNPKDDSVDAKSPKRTNRFRLKFPTDYFDID